MNECVAVKSFFTTALQQGKVELTWDEADITREQKLRKGVGSLFVTFKEVLSAGRLRSFDCVELPLDKRDDIDALRS